MSVCDLEIIDHITIDSENNIYPCYNHSYTDYRTFLWNVKFHKLTNITDIIIKAVYFLEIDKLKIILASTPRETIINLKSSNSNNIIDMIVGTSSSVTHSQKPNYNKLTLDMLKPIPSTPEESAALTAACILLEYLCPNYPELITTKTFELCNINRNQQMYKTLITNYIEPEPESSATSDECHICFSTFPLELIDNICSCKNKIHLNCLLEIVNHASIDKCMSCNTPLKSHKINEHIMFPHSGIYKQFHTMNYIFLTKPQIHEQLYYALSYLHTERVDELLNKITTEELLNYQRSASYGDLHHEKPNDTLKLSDYLSTGLSRSTHKHEYDRIEYLLRLKLSPDLIYFRKPTITTQVRKYDRVELSFTEAPKTYPLFHHVSDVSVSTQHYVSKLPYGTMRDLYDESDDESDDEWLQPIIFGKSFDQQSHESYGTWLERRDDEPSCLQTISFGNSFNHSNRVPFTEQSHKSYGIRLERRDDVTAPNPTKSRTIEQEFNLPRKLSSLKKFESSKKKSDQRNMKTNLRKTTKRR
ncbi:MAG: hypothetical protein Gaeavirus1_7 [Gaeavirus sp.]|uniref:RING-type domain-containing protein n=1 Tax=Gaeavirus sp. TaxID=2487767 RepID=A0A3G4ZYD6_9VIRU|nr:MAG: hypothetical protein Gaeavirus1_7 [Gaeavirus sp.]